MGGLSIIRGKYIGYSLEALTTSADVFKLALLGLSILGEHREAWKRLKRLVGVVSSSDAQIQSLLRQYFRAVWSYSLLDAKIAGPRDLSRRLAVIYLLLSWIFRSGVRA